jgi:hypothetical protein
MEKEKELFEAFVRSEKWFSDNYEKLRERYGSKFFAILDGEVIAAEDEFEKLLSILEQKKVDFDKVFVASIPPKSIASIL